MRALIDICKYPGYLVYQDPYRQFYQAFGREGKGYGDNFSRLYPSLKSHGQGSALLRTRYRICIRTGETSYVYHPGYLEELEERAL